MLIDSSAAVADSNGFNMDVNAPQFQPRFPPATAAMQYGAQGFVPHYYPYNFPPFSQTGPNMGPWFAPYAQYPQPQMFNYASNDPSMNG